MIGLSKKELSIIRYALLFYRDEVSHGELDGMAGLRDCEEKTILNNFIIKLEAMINE